MRALTEKSNYKIYMFDCQQFSIDSGKMQEKILTISNYLAIKSRKNQNISNQK